MSPLKLIETTALQELSTLMGAVAADDDRMRKLVASAEAGGFAFDD
jgi:hypothetical protein